MDYRKLLRKYLAHINEVEGANFFGQPSKHLNDEDLEELEKLEELNLKAIG